MVLRCSYSAPTFTELVAYSAYSVWKIFCYFDFVKFVENLEYFPDSTWSGASDRLYYYGSTIEP